MEKLKLHWYWQDSRILDSMVGGTRQFLVVEVICLVYFDKKCDSSQLNIHHMNKSRRPLGMTNRIKLRNNRPLMPSTIQGCARVSGELVRCNHCRNVPVTARSSFARSCNYYLWPRESSWGRIIALVDYVLALSAHSLSLHKSKPVKEKSYCCF